MADTIEISKSARASCRTCKQKIDKDVLRFGEEVENRFSPDGGMTTQWHHMECAAGRMPLKVKAAMAAYTGDIPDRAKLEGIIANPPAKPKGARGGAKGTYPYAERASTGRSKCMSCDEAIDKDTFRIAVEREVDTGAFTTKGPGYLHPACAAGHTGDDGLFEKVKANTPGLSPEDLAALEADL